MNDLGRFSASMAEDALPSLEQTSIYAQMCVFTFSCQSVLPHLKSQMSVRTCARQKVHSHLSMIKVCYIEKYQSPELA